MATPRQEQSPADGGIVVGEAVVVATTPLVETRGRQPAAPLAARDRSGDRLHISLQQQAMPASRSGASSGPICSA